MTPEPLAVALPNGDYLRGSRWPGNDCWALLLHEPGDERDSDDLLPLVRAVGRTGATAVTFDLPGHGFSDGDWSPETDLTESVGTLLDWIDRHEPAKVAIVAVGATCFPALNVASGRAVDILVLVSPSPRSDLATSPKQFRGEGAAKLLVFGGADTTVRDTAIAIRTRSIGWAVSLSVGTQEQGAALLAGTHGARVEEGVELFLREQWVIGRRRDKPAKQQEETAR